MRWFFLLLLFSGIVNAKAYKCEINGQVSYSQSPCPKGGNTKVLLSDQDRSQKSQQQRSKKATIFSPEMIAKQFTEETGEHIKLVAVLKKSMNKPDSFEHIATHYTNNQNGTLTVTMDYYVENQFASAEARNIKVITDINSGKILQQIK